MKEFKLVLMLEQKPDIMFYVEKTKTGEEIVVFKVLENGCWYIEGVEELQNTTIKIEDYPVRKISKITYNTIDNLCACAWENSILNTYHNYTSYFADTCTDSDIISTKWKFVEQFSIAKNLKYDFNGNILY